MLAAIEALLGTLPHSAPQIAAHLVDAGVTGIKDQGTCCPLSRWMRRELNVPYVKVDVIDITVIDDQGNTYNVATPDHLGGFITMFDLDQVFDDLVDVNGPTDEELHTIEDEEERGSGEPIHL